MRINLRVIIGVALLFACKGLLAVPTIQNWQTDNGANIYFVPTDGLPILDVQLVFDAGSARDEKKGGVAALTSTLLNQGAAGKNAQNIAELLDSVGAQLDVSTSRDFTTISYRSLTDETALLTSWRVLKELVNEPDFPELDLKREKERTLLDIKERQDSPGTLAQLALYGEIYKGHPYANAIQGEEVYVSGIKVRDLQDFYKQYYVAKNLVVVLVGGVSRNQVERMVDDLVGGLPAGKKASPISKVKVHEDGKSIHQEFPSQQTHLMYSVPVLRHKDPDYFPLFVGNHILGGSGFSSRIAKEIREKKGLAYSAYSFFHPMVQQGPFLIGLQTRNEKVNEASEAIKKTLQEFIQHGPTEDELISHKKNIMGGFALKLDSNKKLLGNVVEIVVSGAPLDYLTTYTQKIDALTREQITEAFQRRVLMERMVMVTVGQTVEQID